LHYLRERYVSRRFGVLREAQTLPRMRQHVAFVPIVRRGKAKAPSDPGMDRLSSGGRLGCRWEPRRPRELVRQASRVRRSEGCGCGDRRERGGTDLRRVENARRRHGCCPQPRVPVAAVPRGARPRRGGMHGHDLLCLRDALLLRLPLRISIAGGLPCARADCPPVRWPIRTRGNGAAVPEWSARRQLEGIPAWNAPGSGDGHLGGSWQSPR
jgi:hypothetical protein